MTTPLDNQELDKKRLKEQVASHLEGYRFYYINTKNEDPVHAIKFHDHPSVSWLVDLIYSEAHRIGNLAIGEDDKHGVTDIAFIISDAINQEKFRQRQKLSELTKEME